MNEIIDRKLFELCKPEGIGPVRYVGCDCWYVSKPGEEIHGLARIKNGEPIQTDGHLDDGYWSPSHSWSDLAPLIEKYCGRIFEATWGLSVDGKPVWIVEIFMGEFEPSIKKRAKTLPEAASLALICLIEQDEIKC